MKLSGPLKLTIAVQQSAGLVRMQKHSILMPIELEHGAVQPAGTW